MIKCLNLCEILSPKNLKRHTVEEIIQKATQDESFDVDRIYLGSSFCSQYFLRMSNFWDDILEYAQEHNIPVTLTLPIFSQKDLSIAKERIKNLLQNPAIDEVTVNDFGNLNYIDQNYDLKINLGRLFFKDPRDIRVPEYFESESTPSWLSQSELLESVSGLELDQTAKSNLIPKSIENTIVSVHYPYTYMTTGNICKFASIPKPLERKFRPNDNCNLECTRIHEFFIKDFGRDIEEELFRLGRSVYFLNDEAKFDTENGREPDRMIYFPLKELALLDEIEDE